MSEPAPASSSWLRGLVAVIALPLITLAAVWQLYQIGVFDELAKKRIRYLAQEPLYGGPDCTWLGVPVYQYPTDLVIYQEMIEELKPDVIIETGTYRGGTSLFLSSILDYANPTAKVVTVDIDPSHWQETQKSLDPKLKERLLGRVVFVEGSSVAPEVVAKVKAEIKPGNKVLVLLDSNHSTDHVRKELDAYAPLVTVGSYVLVNDTHLEQWLGKDVPLGGAMEAVRQFMANNPKFTIDHARSNKYVISCFPSGALKRVQ